MAFTKVYEIKKSDRYRNSAEVYRLLPNNRKQALEEIIPKEIYSAIIFSENVLKPIEYYCEKFFECADKGLSYHIGCYFQKKEYQSVGQMKADIDRFESLSKIYNKKDFPNEYELIDLLIKELHVCKDRYAAYEECCPELFEESAE